ncbi:MAG TPA: indole-3-glycerol phosphate synthase TrpC [Gemmatimonadales bacterium]|jgi:indole-3-glycerol phosphate synthase|nr:indole-3-glycerol phosphate synthase TrpC [Gemmatimonadales bacterium]
MGPSLAEILESTRRSIDGLRSRRAELERAAAGAPVPRSFATALRGGRVALIAEVKRRSPSSGLIQADLDPARQADAYADGGAAAISVLTDRPFFGGSIGDLEQVVARVGVPVLRKDFILDESQVFEARASGAAAILLIVRALTPARLSELQAVAKDAGLDSLVEVHTERELDGALNADARVIGVNSRDLDTFRIDVDSAWRLIREVPADRIVVAESGMATVADVERAASAGADAVLVGTALSGSADPAASTRALASVRRHGR